MLAKTVGIFVILMSILSGCNGEDALDLKIRFDEIRGLKQGDRVIYGQNDIGRVKKVSYSREGRFLVYVVIKRDFKNMITEYSRFFIVPDPREKDRMAIETTQIREGGRPLEDGATVEGVTKLSTFLDKNAAELEEGIGKLKEQLEGFSKGLEEVLESEELKRLEKELGELVQEANRLGKTAREKLEKEVLPRLKREMEELKKKMEKPHQEEKRPKSI